MTRYLSLALLAVSASAFAADAPAPGTPVVSVGVVSADQKLVFVPAKEGGIEALDLASGRVMWSNKAAARLAGASDKLVLAWVGDEKKANAFRVVAMEAATGKTVVKSDPITMPDWANTAQPWGRKFRTAAKADGDSVSVVWQASAFYAGGARPSPEIEAAARKNEFGLARVDLKTGEVTAADGKPKDDDFKVGPAGGGVNKLGDYEFGMTEQDPDFKPGAPRLTTKVRFTVLKGGKELWTRELAGNPWSQPPP